MTSDFMICGVKVNINAIARIFTQDASTSNRSSSMAYNKSLLWFGFHMMYTLGWILAFPDQKKKESVPESLSRRATLSCWFLLVRLLWVVILLSLQYQTWDDRDLVFPPTSSFPDLWQNTPILNGEMSWQFWLWCSFVDMILLIRATNHNME